ncbi:MAG TPA: hypothetical protein PK431_14240 [Chitinophagales bacterium]|nr:hypothetical protein [Chitinophagales bacterium]
MKKVISYAIFGEKERTPENSFEFFTYMRGIFFNVLMNRLIFPAFTTHIETDVHTFSAYDHIFRWLQESMGCTLSINEQRPLCLSMLWRMKPVFDTENEYVFCRDSDALTTYREAQAVQEFLHSGLVLHNIADNPSHTSSIMGGLCGFKCEPIREKYGTWENLLEQCPDIDFSFKGSDQNLLNRTIYPEFKNQMFIHLLSSGNSNGEKKVSHYLDETQELEGVPQRLYESNFCIKFIGAAGCVEMETIRFLKRHLSLEMECGGKDRYYPKIFNWIN